MHFQIAHIDQGIGCYKSFCHLRHPPLYSADPLMAACIASSLALRRLSAYACSFGSVTSTQQALRCALLPDTGSSGGMVRQILRAKAQRGMNGQPGGGFSKSGGAPSMVLNVACLSSSRRGTEANNPKV